MRSSSEVVPVSLAVGKEAASPSLTASSLMGVGGRVGVDVGLNSAGVASLTLAELLADVDSQGRLHL